MSFVYYNPNPKGKIASDCTVRAISLATGKPWDDIYVGLVAEGFEMKDMPSVNEVWSAYLINHEGFIKHRVHEVMTIKEFSYYNNLGIFILGTGNHVVALINGDYYDTWDSGEGIPIYFFKKEFK